MAEFLTATDTSAAIERVIREAKKELTLISAYVYPRFIYLERLRDAAARGVQITLVFGKRKMDNRVKSQFEQVSGLRIHFLDELHAKCYCNEKHAVVTSLNLLNSSEARNREMGVLLDAQNDAKAYADCMAEVQSILQASNLVYSSRTLGERPSVRTNSTFPKAGFCIRCGKNEQCDPDAPLCMDDFKVWVRHEDPQFPEHYCHTCGQRAQVCMAKPMCAGCMELYRPAIDALNASRKIVRSFGRRTWRE
ncbi:MAG: phospholipase D family protein [Flavobacteriales bacterium]|nr:phospholipase D family protein [Flavobacteriales bacterium]